VAYLALVTSPIARPSFARLPRSAALWLVAAAYALAGAVGILVGFAVPAHPLWQTLAGDGAATLVIFVLSMLIDNASLYDPYWSVAPPVIVACWLATTSGVPARRLVLALAVLAWATRLTANWAGGWRGLGHEDWRYRQLRSTRGKAPWWLVNLFGIQLMPTLFVYIGLLSAWPAVTGTRGFGVVDVVALVACLASVSLEAAADLQVHRFAADPANGGRSIDVGVWRWSRHPNYLGEIGFWCGLYLFGVAAAPEWWWTVAGPVVMVVLFTAISIPLMERHLAQRRPDYADYRRRVPALLPLPRRRP
jgi:steroid 5-alpha reductase family enzyme